MERIREFCCCVYYIEKLYTCKCGTLVAYLSLLSSACSISVGEIADMNKTSAGPLAIDVDVPPHALHGLATRARLLLLATILFIASPSRGHVGHCMGI